MNVIMNTVAILLYSCLMKMAYNTFDLHKYFLQIFYYKAYQRAQEDWDLNIKQLLFKIYSIKVSEKVSENKEYLFNIIRKFKENPLYENISLYNWRLHNLIDELKDADNNALICKIQNDLLYIMTNDFPTVNEAVACFLWSIVDLFFRMYFLTFLTVQIFQFIML
jgi:hypothetical protein